uniref:Tail specific protease N-terminal domain-containing protein n=1 Tax=Thermodesulfobacterium geofontis TaxID=1295609 RepID=A0A7C4NS78_9BACT
MFAYLKTFLKTIHRESTDKKDISNRRIPFLSLCILVIFQIINVNVFAVETENQPQYLSQSISKLVENHYFPLIDPQYLSKSTTFFQVELLEAYKIMVDESTQDLEKRINASRKKLLILLNKDILDYDPNFTYENGLRVG